MQELTILTREKLTMSSREIADLAGARHNDVIATITRFFDKGLLRSSRESRIEQTGGRPTVVFDLVERDVYLVISGYSDELRAKIIDRWQELEASHQAPTQALSQLEILAQQAQQSLIAAQGLLEIDRQQKAMAQQLAATTETLARIDTQLEQVAANRVWDRCPQNCEPITKIRVRIYKMYGLPSWLVDTVMRQLPLSPKVHAMIKNTHEGANGSQYEVWAIADVTRVFSRFVAESEQCTPAFATHPYVAERFRIKPGFAKQPQTA
jgi:phage regulator Rha-like protein